MEILFVSTELAPYVKVGGLADVVAALPKALRQLGHKATVLLPRFPAFEAAGLSLARRLTPLKFTLGGKAWEVTVYDARLPTQVELVLIDAPGLYDRDGVYGGRETGEDFADNAVRFAVLSRAAAEIVKQRAASGTPFDIVHCQDWPTALVPTYLREIAKEHPELAAPKTLLTIHNLAHQGTFPKDAFPSLGLPAETYRIDGIEFYGGVNILKLGILTADAVTTVSTTYAREIQTPELGYKLDGVLRERARAVIGITNGVDYAVWNPATDPAIAARYDAEDPANKVRCKGALQKELGLPIDAAAPLVASVGRIVVQ
jgi:starch synthase